jgi:aldose 1-epimerase
MNVSKELFGEVSGQTVDLYTLSNDNGMTVKITNYGGIVTSIIIPDDQGNTNDVVCGFDTLARYFSEEYTNNAPYFGGIIGRYAARIKDGTFALNGESYSLATNNAPNHLHGGIVGFDKKIWQASLLKESNCVGLSLTLISADGEEGYPGNLSVEVQYRLTNENAIKVTYIANTDKDTPVSLTNHSYFNLSGFKDDIKGHNLQVNADKVLLPDETNVPVGEIKNVDGIDDFIQEKNLGKAIEQLDCGFEHYLVFNKASEEKSQVVELSDPKSGRRLKVVTTEPGMLFYTGHFTSDKLQRESGEQYGQYRGVCFETSKYPNGPNISSSPKSILTVGNTYQEETQFQFSW